MSCFANSIAEGTGSGTLGLGDGRNGRNEGCVCFGDVECGCGVVLDGEGFFSGPGLSSTRCLRGDTAEGGKFEAGLDLAFEEEVVVDADRAKTVHPTLAWREASCDLPEERC